MADDKPKSAIWLEVAEVLFDEEETKVQLKGDREHPKPHWWSVDAAAVSALLGPGQKGQAYTVYKAILNEMDKKRSALARLEFKDDGLRCTALRFQSPDLTSRTS